MRKNYQKRDKFFFANPRHFPNWEYPSRNAIGMKFSDFKAIDEDVFRFQVGGRMYEIDREKAMILGNKYVLPFGSLPNLIPIDEFEDVTDQQLF